MNTRIRHIVHRRKGIVVQHESIVQKQSITIGRATDQDIFLSDLGVTYKHARINLSESGQIGLSSLSQAGFYVNGKFAQSGSLKGRGELQVGPYKIVIEYNHDGYDFDITVEQIAEDAVELQSETMPAMTLEETWLSRRRGAWVGFLLVIIIFLAFPLAGYFDKDVAKMERGHAFIPSDSSWNSGAISSVHKHFAKDCDSCHLKAFERVPDKACIKCHEGTTVHADPDFFDLHALQGIGCESCHKEHSGDDYLIRKDQSLCSDCHEDLNRKVETDMENVSDFTKQHPEFQPNLFTRNLDEWESDDPSLNKWQRVSLKKKVVKQETGLIFPHKLHLDKKGIESPEGDKVLQCDSCHREDITGRYMVPVEFERDCQSCHELTFDLNQPERTLPHSNLDAMTATLEEFYAYVALRGDYDGGTAEIDTSIRPRRIPGKEASSEVKPPSALDWAEYTAKGIKDEMISIRACGFCHKVVPDGTQPSGWLIPDVHISQRWFTRGAFDHDLHEMADCETCHDARESSRSEDVLMPKIKVCRECHGGEHASDGKLSSTCISCHVFHVPGAILLGDRGTKRGNNYNDSDKD